MSRRIDIRPAALVDVDDIARYIRKDSVDAAIRFYDATRDTFRSLAQMPGMGPAIRSRSPELQGIRKWAIHGFLNYLVFYRADEVSLEIVRVLHGARRVYQILRNET